MDLLAEALKEKQLSEQECNDFIRNVKAVGSKLPVNSIALRPSAEGLRESKVKVAHPNSLRTRERRPQRKYSFKKVL